MSMAIKLRGGTPEEAITVQRFEVEDGEPVLAWCNHAGAVEETDIEENHYPDDRPSQSWRVWFMQCDKCGAYKNLGESHWEDAPANGVSYDGVLYDRDNGED